MLGRNISDAVGVGYVISRILRTSLDNCVSDVSKRFLLPNRRRNLDGVPLEYKDATNTTFDEAPLEYKVSTSASLDTFEQVVNKDTVEKLSIKDVKVPRELQEEVVKSVLESPKTVIIDQTHTQPELKDLSTLQETLPTEKEIIPPRKLVEAKLPTTRVGRIYQYTSLAASLGFGAASEAIKRSIGLSKSQVGESALWNESNVNLIVSRLSRMRGAAQKLGQILSIQDANVLPPQIEKILFEIQHSGTFMPKDQLLNVLRVELGEDWETHLLEFDMTPFAAASIGQVHWAKVLNENSVPENVAVKVQYPGVAKAIDSDLDSLKLLLVASRLLPRGLYLEKTIQVARRELKWETDYEREAAYALKFAEALASNSDFRVPKIYSHLSTKMVMTMERLPGLPLSHVLDYPQKVRDWIATKLMQLSLREVFEFKFMQTDPNWTNFLYDPVENRLGVLDFGATREFSDDFLSDYLEVLKSGVSQDRKKCQEYSHRLGYLTGDEHSSMIEAHIDSIMTLAEPFRAPEEYDFANQTITARVRSLIPIMLQMRLTPPPEPTCSLHRKLSGAFLLCARLRARVNCREIFESVASSYQKTDCNEIS